MLHDFIAGARDASAPERAQARRLIWDRLPSELRGERQYLGRMSPGCTATHGVHEACDFGCTACYLASTANRTPPLSFEAVRAQIDAIRAWAGPGGNIQLTAGEVTLLPREALARLVRYARDQDLDPMVMSHGQTFDRDPSYLHHLMEAGLQKISLHVDSTQRGRRGVPSRPTEADLMGVRGRFSALIREARATTGRPLHASHTLTVTQDNLPLLPGLLRWTLLNADAFRLFSCNTVAEVGRTRGEAYEADERLYAAFEEGAGRRLPRTTFNFGHPRCSTVNLMWVVRFGERVEVVPVAREDAPVDSWFMRQLNDSAFEGFNPDDGSQARAAGALAGLFARSPDFLWKWPAYSLYRLLGERRWLPEFLMARARGERCFVRPFAIIVHNFMSAADLDTDEGRARLQACAFRLPVDGEMVPMCQFNGTEARREANLVQIG